MASKFARHSPCSMATTPLSAASSLVEAEDLLDPAENEELDKAVLSELPPEFRVRPPEPTNAYVPAFALSFIASNSKGTIDRRLRYIGEGYTLFQQNPELLDLLWSSVENKSFRQFRNLGKLTQVTPYWLSLTSSQSYWLTMLRNKSPPSSSSTSTSGKIQARSCPGGTGSRQPCLGGQIVPSSLSTKAKTPIKTRCSGTAI